jgi:hypothetical protein
MGGCVVKPLAIDLYCGLGGWAEGFLAEGYRVVGFDIERHDYGTGGYPGELVLEDVLSLHGSRFADAAVIVASPPCQAYSYRAMPWKRAKALPPPDNSLFEACFRIQREVSEASGRHVPLIVENVRGAQRWVGRAAWHFGSYYLWGDIPALMPIISAAKFNPDGTEHGPGSWFAIADSKNRGTRSQKEGEKEFVKVSGNDWNDFKRIGKVSPHWRMQLLEQRAEAARGNGSWFGNYAEAKEAGRGSANRYTSSNSLARKKASALIAKIPFPLAQHIARVFKPDFPPALTSNHELLGSGPIPSALDAESER